MTPEEVFAQLRDIHSPAIEAVANASFDVRPLIAFAIFLAGVLIIRRVLADGRRKTALARIDPSSDPAAQRDALAKLATTTTRPQNGDTPPDALFDPPEALTQKAIADLRNWVRRRLP